MSKQKSHRGTLKRIKITGTGKVKMMRAGGRHLRSHRSKTLQNSFRKPAFLSAPDVVRLQPGLLTKIRSVSAVEEERRQREAEMKGEKKD